MVDPKWRPVSGFEGPTPERVLDWGRDNVRANRFLLDSASFYLSARRLLVRPDSGSVMPGLVCGAYALEQLIKAALEYVGIDPPTKGNQGHNLPYLAGRFPTPTEAKTSDLELFTKYFNSRYFDNKNRAEMLNSGDYKKLDDLYYAFYARLNIPLQFHHRTGLLSLALSDRLNGREQRAVLELDNAHFDDYVTLCNPIFH